MWQQPLQRRRTKSEFVEATWMQVDAEYIEKPSIVLPQHERCDIVAGEAQVRTK